MCRLQHLAGTTQKQRNTQEQSTLFWKPISKYQASTRGLLVPSRSRSTRPPLRQNWQHAGEKTDERQPERNRVSGQSNKRPVAPRLSRFAYAPNGGESGTS